MCMRVSNWGAFRWCPDRLGPGSFWTVFLHPNPARHQLYALAMLKSLESPSPSCKPWRAGVVRFVVSVFGMRSRGWIGRDDLLL